MDSTVSYYCRLRALPLNIVSEPQISPDINSPNIAKIMGTNTSAFELLVLKRKIMGPCWLKIRQAELTHKNVSHNLLPGYISQQQGVSCHGAKLKSPSTTARRSIPFLTMTPLHLRNCR